MIFAADCLTEAMYPPDQVKNLLRRWKCCYQCQQHARCKIWFHQDYIRTRVTVILQPGEITHLGATVSKTSSGYSLLNLMIGSEGTLGIITELTLKIIPAPKASASLIVPFEDLKTALETVPKLKMSSLNPQAIEFMEREIVLASERHTGRSTFPREMGGQPVGAYLPGHTGF